MSPAAASVRPLEFDRFGARQPGRRVFFRRSEGLFTCA